MALTTPSRNPFRNPNLTPSPASASTSTPTPTPAPPASSSTVTVSPPSSSSTPPRSSDPLGLTEDAPPAYTPGADVYQGETTLEIGPPRPFQPPPQQFPPPQPLPWNQPYAPTPNWQPAPQQQFQYPQYTGYQSPRPSSTGSVPWSSYPGQQSVSQQYAPNSNLPQAPPRHPHTRHASAAAPSTRPSSDFARDFYAAGPDPHEAFSPPTTNSNAASSSSSSYAPPPGVPPPSTRPSYNPPPGPPPGAAATSAAQSEIPDDGKPTKVPVAGHPLLKDGMTLVYPSGYECDKCTNTGYKNSDPAHPCGRCWDKYSKPYAGALRYAPTSNTTPGKSTFQRPLPSLQTPHLLAPHPPPTHPSLRRSRSQNMYTPPTHTPLPPSQVALTSQGSFPPDALVLRPGDPRMGGRLCWKCGGTGNVQFLVFENVRCGVCGGAGRVFG